MAVGRITRQDLVEQSVTDFLREKLFTERAYPADRVELVDSFQPSTFEPMTTLDKTYVALGFNYDDGGTPGEMGSDLVRLQHTIEVWVIAETPVIGRNLANAIRDSLDDDGVIPLKDIRVAGQPIIDWLIVDRVRAERQPIADPRPWQENVWITYVQVTDEYYARLV